ncbi:MAG: hypothetical protein HYU51_17685 [Candidatus Rokubacteria bacterium]|nr:hypothetical protein [Candidatus Rokubacteria bacterium]
MASIFIALTSSPDVPAGQRALALAESLAGEGQVLTLCCLQDAVLLGSTRAPREAGAALGRLRDRGARCLVLGPDLALRGLQRDLHAEAVDYPDVIAALAAGPDRVAGAF